MTWSGLTPAFKGNAGSLGPVDLAAGAQKMSPKLGNLKSALDSSTVLDRSRRLRGDSGACPRSRRRLATR